MLGWGTISETYEAKTIAYIINGLKYENNRSSKQQPCPHVQTPEKQQKRNKNPHWNQYHCRKHTSNYSFLMSFGTKPCTVGKSKIYCRYGYISNLTGKTIDKVPLLTCKSCHDTKLRPQTHHQIYSQNSELVSHISSDKIGSITPALSRVKRNSFTFIDMQARYAITILIKYRAEVKQFTPTVLPTIKNHHRNMHNCFVQIKH